MHSTYLSLVHKALNNIVHLVILHTSHHKGVIATLAQLHLYVH